MHEILTESLRRAAVVLSVADFAGKTQAESGETAVMTGAPRA
jgi:hypothetical protein